MKYLLIIFAIIALPTISFTQNYPDCNHFAVEGIYMDDDTTNLMKVTISNSCLDCASGMWGCVYMELRVIRTVTPFDTIAATSCYCLISPDNESQSTYRLSSTVSTLPPLSDIRVSFEPNVCGCDTIEFSSSLEVVPPENENSITIFPNPANDYIMISSSSENISRSIITDIKGNTIGENKLNSNNSKVDISNLSQGIYFIEIIDKNNVVLKRSKVVKN